MIKCPVCNSDGYPLYSMGSSYPTVCACSEHGLVPLTQDKQANSGFSKITNGWIA